MILKTKIGM